MLEKKIGGIDPKNKSTYIGKNNKTMDLMRLLFKLDIINDR
jgi:hypothetical protein